MEEVSVDRKQPLLPSETSIAKPKGGFKTLPSIIANESLEKVASFGLTANMTRYLTRDYGMSAAGASDVIFLWSAASNFTPVLGSFVADSIVGRFPMIGFGSIVCFLGMVLLWLTATIPEAKPSCHELTGACGPSTAGQLLLLFSSLGVMSVGAGGLRAASLAFGADQLKRDGSPSSSRAFESYVSWYYVSVTVSVLVGMTFIVYIQDHMGWKVGFGVPVVLMFLSVLAFFAASSLYVKSKPNATLITGLVQGAVASYRKREVQFNSGESDVTYHHKAGQNLQIPSQKLRFLNKACVVRNPAELTADGKPSDPWSLSTVDKVEELKALIRIIPIWSTGIISGVNITPNSFSYLQTASMDRHVTPNFEIPTGSFGSFMLVAIIIFIPIYDRILLPLASKIIGKPARLNVKQKMGTGIIFMSLSLAASAVVESRRRAMAIEEGFSDDPYGVVKMSALWTLPGLVLMGMAEAFIGIGQNEFYLSELPTAMSSIAISIGGLNMFAGNLVASLVMTAVGSWTKGGGHESWVSSNINRGHGDYYNWLLCGLNSANFVYFVLCCRGYGPTKDEENDNSCKLEM